MPNEFAKRTRLNAGAGHLYVKSGFLFGGRLRKPRRGPGVTMGIVYKNSSASQITTKRLCPRKWYFGSILKIPQPQTDSLVTGNACHDDLETYSNTGKLPSYLSVLMDVLPHIPSPKTQGVGAEVQLENPDMYLAKIRIRGFIDLFDTREVSTRRHVTITDYKTMKQLRYAKTDYELAQNVQLMIYAGWALQKFPTLTDITVRHINISTSENKLPTLSEATVTSNHVVQYVETLTPDLEDMKRWAAMDKVEDVPADRSACWAMGGCPYKDRCPADPMQNHESIESIFTDVTTSTEVPLEAKETSTMTLAEKIRAQGIIPPDAPKYDVNPPSANVTAPPVQGATTSTAPSVSTGFELYVDCFPLKGVEGTVVGLEAEIAKRSEEICQKHHTKSIYEAPLDFGKGKDKLAESFRLNPPAGVVLAASGGLSTAVIEVLMPLASKVVKRLG